ncbi:hypothetical protein [Paraburkholderia silvatlantica]|uniref:Uncharacterized protein n=1 Tax=Paraburkholderia silvatlantica TaxID=321895 RepID=A0ABR6FM91_9BURK|nr:hypothetical protein [Paraburkholderia silvatlantica]MBB2928540.1 hypothetical protein [Paraburkholderia silvatlantica]
MKRTVRDFVTLFNAFWYRDFPVAANGKISGSRAEWTTHIGICVRSTADMMGYFTYFEAGNRTDAVIKDARDEPQAIANVEWEWTQPFSPGFNELEKLYERRAEVDFSVLVTYSRKEHHQQNLERIRAVWDHSEEPLLVFLVCFEFAGHRNFSKLETHIAQRGVLRKVREQPALPWMAKGTRWSLQVQSGDERDSDSLEVTAE